MNWDAITGVLSDGRWVEFVETEDPPSGGMKKTYFSPDRSYVVQFFHDQSAKSDPQRIARLEAIIGKYNPTIPESHGGAKGVSQLSASYFSKLFCWPTAVVVRPQFGIVAPTYSDNYFFATGKFKGREKEGRWFSSPKLRRLLPEEEVGPWINYFKLCILMTRAVRRLHAAGLAHSDLSPKNVLIDPSRGECVVIDIDSLVVPQLFPPDVMGTPGYIAPEVLATQNLSIHDTSRRQPSTKTDQHALAVLIYEYLLFRHPLRGPKVNSTASAEEDEHLSMGERALFVEHPSDQSNRPADLRIPYSILGPYLGDLFHRAFVKGLHSPNSRPGAMEWERGLTKTLDLLHPCPNPTCSHKWFVLMEPEQVRCTFCGTRPREETIPILKLRTQRRPGQWMPDGHLVLNDNQTILKWHAFDNAPPGEEADWTPQASCVFHEGQWLLVNQHLLSLTTPDGDRVPPGKAIALRDGDFIRFSQEPHGRIAEVRIAHV